MPGQFVDKKTVGIPPDIVQYRHDCEVFRNESRYYSEESEASAGRAANSATQAQTSAEEAYNYMLEAEAWAEFHSEGVHFAPDEPDFEKRYDGMLWLQTDEDNLTIIHIYRWDSKKSIVGSLYPAEDLFPDDDVFPGDVGGWTEFKLYSPTTIY